jgi:Nuclease-related domain
MLLKSADDKSKRLTLLEDLQYSQLLDSRQKDWLNKEFWTFKQGLQGERDSAHYIDSYFKDGENHVVLHDLRFEIDGEIAQIDHLILNRGGIFYLLETKNFNGNLIINEHGEFTVHYADGRRFGIHSPIEQSLRHERVLRKLLARLEIEGRTQALPEFHHVVMLHPKAIIERPPATSFDTSNVIKADQFPTWHQRFVDKLGVGSVLKFALNLRNLDTLQEQGKKLMRQHRPADLLALPEFMKPQKSTPTKVSPTVATPLEQISNHQITRTQSDTARSRATGPALNPIAKPWACAHCSKRVGPGIQKYCLDDPKRFGGLVFCMEHQSLAPPT